MEQAVHARMRELQDRHWWFEGRRRILTDVIVGLRPPEGARILEVGCGSGANLKMLSRFGQVCGMEPDDVARDYASRTAGVPVERGLLPDQLPFADASFDLVCALDVIEHVDADGASVAALARLAKPGGYLAATVPAYSWMWSNHDVAHHHKRRYDGSAFERLFEDAGLEVVKASHFNALLLPAAIAGRWAKRVLNRKTPDDAMPPPWLNRTLLGLMETERHVLKRGSLPFGLSLLVVARRNA